MIPEQAVKDFRRRMLRLESGTEAILAAAAEHPDDPMVQMCAATLHLYGQTEQDMKAASKYLEAADRCGAEARAPHFFHALGHLRARRHEEAARSLEDATRADPHDLLSAKICEFAYYILGQQHCGPRYRAHMERLTPFHEADPDFLSMRSFAHELCDDFTQARRFAEQAIQIEPRNPWAEHTLSHVMIRLGEVGPGEDRLRKFLPVAASFSRPIHSHTAWHLALFDLERLDHARAFSLFRSDIWGFSPDSVVEQVDAIALLWRLEMAGGSAQDSWSSVADHVEARTRESFMPFLSAHHAYALARAGREPAVEALCATIDANSDDSVWQTTGRSVVRAAVASGQERWRDAATLLDPVMKRVAMIGGSDAQDDLFRQMYLVALAKSGRAADARAVLEASAAPGRQSTALDGYFRGLA